MPIFDVPLEQLQTRGSIKWRRFEPDVLPMFVAEMDCQIADPIRERLERALRDGDTGYAEGPVYQDAMVDYANWQWGWQFDPANAVLAGDVVGGMRETLEVISEPGDAVVINPPIYPPFRGISFDRRIIEVPMRGDRLDLAALEQAFEQYRPKVYLLCSPHNPTGTVHTLEELTAVAELAQRYGVTVVSDEIHAPLSGSEHVPYLNVPGAEHAVVIISASKSWNLAALKAGLVIGERSILDKLSPMMSEKASYFGVLSHATALLEARDWLQEASKEIAQNKQHFAAELARALPVLNYTPSQGTFLGWLDCAPLGLEDPAQFFHEVARVRFSPGADFAPEDQQFVRVNLATSPEIITAAVERLAVASAQR